MTGDSTKQFRTDRQDKGPSPALQRGFLDKQVRLFIRSYQKMNMVAHHTPGTDPNFSFLLEARECIEHLFPFFFIKEDILSVQTAQDDMIKTTFTFLPAMPRHFHHPSTSIHISFPVSQGTCPRDSNINTSLRESNCVDGMSLGNATDWRKCPIKFEWGSVLPVYLYTCFLAA